MFETRSIAYSAGRIDIHSDSSMNDWLSVEEGETGLVLKAANMGFLGGDQTGGMTKEQAAEFFWRLFINPLER